MAAVAAESAWTSCRKTPFSARSAGESIAEAIDRLDQLGARCRGVQLPAQVLDVGVDGPVAHDPIVGIHLVHQLLPRKHPPGPGAQRVEESEFDRGKFEVAAIEQRTELVVFELQSVVWRPASRASASAQNGLHPGDD